MKQFLTAVLLALSSAGSISAQEADTTHQRITAEVGRQETGAPISAPAWQSRNASEEAARDMPAIKSRVSRLESQWCGLQRLASTARRHKDFRSVRAYTDRANSLSLQIISERSRISAVESEVSRQVSKLHFADKGLRGDLNFERSARMENDRVERSQRQEVDRTLADADKKETSDRQIADANESSERKTADQNEATARKSGDNTLAWGIFFLAVITGLGFFLHSLPDD